MKWGIKDFARILKFYYSEHLTYLVLLKKGIDARAICSVYSNHRIFELVKKKMINNFLPKSK
ncbi:hypothetical protein JOC77_000583 [Peribacillus deserti]|uniref:Uncharacterized protein n=1 Tax=Peribacillus deserti TaxID=673318 RepID=A0ABS2QF76_9BACI|nr:hypothetical protein [Peribacillus deserti]